MAGDLLQQVVPRVNTGLVTHGLGVARLGNENRSVRFV